MSLIISFIRYRQPTYATAINSSFNNARRRSLPRDSRAGDNNQQQKAAGWQTKPGHIKRSWRAGCLIAPASLLRLRILLFVGHTTVTQARPVDDSHTIYFFSCKYRSPNVSCDCALRVNRSTSLPTNLVGIYEYLLVFVRRNLLDLPLKPTAANTLHYL